jgi:hypothetical protein
LALVPQKSPPTRGRRLALFGICALAYVYAFPYHPRVNNPNENVRFFMTAALVDDHTFAIEHVREQWGWVNDAAIFEGHVYSVKAPATSYLGVPGYWLYRRYTILTGEPFQRTTALWVVRFTASVLPTLAFLWAFHRWLARRGGPPVVRDAVVLSLGVGSLLYAYGMLFVSHTLSAVVAFGAFMILERARRMREISGGAAFAAGLLAASATAFEYPGFFASALLSVYALFALRKRSYLVNFGVGALIPTASVLVFHRICFGNALTPGHRYLEAEAFRELSHEGFYGSGSFQWDAAGGLLFDLGYGLFPLTPILLLAFIGYPALIANRRTRIDGVFALLIPLTTFLLICTMNNWRGGWTVGARYLAIALPFLGFAAVEGGRVIARFTPRLVGTFSVASLAVGLLASGGPSVYYPHVPEAITRPLPQMLRILVRHDFAPYNAGTFLASTFANARFCGTASMLPLFALGVIALIWTAWGERRTQDRLVVLLGSFFFASWMLTPMIANDANAAGASAQMAYVTEYWDPAGCDRAACIEDRIRDGSASERDFTDLPTTYEAEGRNDDARSARRRAERRDDDGLVPRSLVVPQLVVPSRAHAVIP